MEAEILKAKQNLDSVGGVLKRRFADFPRGLENPGSTRWKALISKGFSPFRRQGNRVRRGLRLCKALRQRANDPFDIKEGKIVTSTNRNGGINGGITNGADIIFKTVIKPTPTISQPQQTVDFVQNKKTVLAAKGRHDPCIVHRARVVIDSVAALAVADLLTMKYGTEWMKNI